MESVMRWEYLKWGLGKLNQQYMHGFIQVELTENKLFILWVNQSFKECVAIGIRIHLSEHWLNSSHPTKQTEVWQSMKIWIGKCFLELSECTSRPTWGPSVVDVQDRTEVLYEVHSRAKQRVSVFLTQHFHCTNTGTHSSHARPNKRQTAWFLYAALKSEEKLAAICLNTVSEAWYFLSEIDFYRARGGESLSLDGQLVILWLLPGLTEQSKS